MVSRKLVHQRNRYNEIQQKDYVPPVKRICINIHKYKQKTKSNLCTQSSLLCFFDVVDDRRRKAFYKYGMVGDDVDDGKITEYL